MSLAHLLSPSTPDSPRSTADAPPRGHTTTDPYPIQIKYHSNHSPGSSTVYPSPSWNNSFTATIQSSNGYQMPTLASLPRHVHSDSRFPVTVRDHPGRPFHHHTFTTQDGMASTPSYGHPRHAITPSDPYGHYGRHHGHHQERGVTYGAAIDSRYPSSGISGPCHMISQPVYSGDSNQQFYVDDGGYHMKPPVLMSDPAYVKYVQPPPQPIIVHSAATRNVSELDPENRYVTSRVTCAPVLTLTYRAGPSRSKFDSSRNAPGYVVSATKIDVPSIHRRSSNYKYLTGNSNEWRSKFGWLAARLYISSHSDRIAVQRT